MANPLYLIEADFGRIGRAFIETDRDQNSRAYVVGLIRSGEVTPVKIIEVCEDEGTVRDVTADILAEAHDLSEDYRNVMTGEDLAAWNADRSRALEMVS